MQIYYKTNHSVELTDAQLASVVKALLKDKVYKYHRNVKQFYFGHVLQIADELGYLKLPKDYEIPDSAVLDIEDRDEDGNIIYNYYD